MLSAITDYIKSRRHQLGKHVVFLGSAARSSPDETRVEDLIAGVALAWAAEHGKPLPNEEPAAAALGLMAAEATDHAERCARLQEAMAGLRPSEAHTRLARMMSDGYFPAVFTTDPTDLLQRGLHNRHMEPDKDYHLMVAGVDPADDIQVALEQSKRIVVVKCAGDMTRGYLPMTPPEVRKSIDTIGAVIERASRQLALFVA